MMKHLKSTLMLLALGCVLAGPAAGDGDSPGRLVVVAGDGVTHTLSFDGEMIEVVSEGDGRSSVHAFNMVALAPVIEEAVTSALASVDVSLASLDLGGIEDICADIDLSSLDDMLDELDNDLVIDLSGDSWQDLDEETRALREEMAALRRELADLKQQLEDR